MTVEDIILKYQQKGVHLYLKDKNYILMLQKE